MALYKKISTAYGIDFSYHKIVDIKIDTYNHTASFNVVSWVDETGREIFEPVAYGRYEAIPINYDNEIISDLYIYLKNLSDFENATDL